MHRISGHGNLTVANMAINANKRLEKDPKIVADDNNDKSNVILTDSHVQNLTTGRYH